MYNIIDNLITEYESLNTEMYIESYINGYDIYESENITSSRKQNIISKLISAIKNLCKKVIDSIQSFINKIISKVKGIIYVPKKTIEDTENLDKYAKELKSISSGSKIAVVKTFIQKHKVATAAVAGAAVIAGGVISGSRGGNTNSSSNLPAVITGSSNNGVPEATVQYGPVQGPKINKPPKNMIALRPEQFQQLSDRRCKAIAMIENCVEKIEGEVISKEEYDKVLYSKDEANRTDFRKKASVNTFRSDANNTIETSYKDIDDVRVELLKNMNIHINNARLKPSDYVIEYAV